VVLAFWFGLLIGCCEIAVVGFRVYCLGKLVSDWPELLWMAPVAGILLLAVPSIVLALGAWLRRPIVTLGLVAFAYLTVTFACVFYYVPGLAGYTRVLLALGLSVQVSRIVARQPRKLSRLIDWTMRWSWPWGGRHPFRVASPETDGTDLFSRRRVLVGSAVAVAGLATTVHGWKWLRERRALRTLPAADPSRPNVLFVVLDTVRAQSLSLYGYGRPTTPNLERVAMQGVTFRRAIAAASWTLPSHATMFTGRWLSETRVNAGIPLGAHYPTLAEVLSARGYETAGFVANTGFLCPAYGLHRGFAHYESLRVSLGQVLSASTLVKEVSENPHLRRLSGYHQDLGRKTAAEINHSLLEWLAGRQADRPFFAFLNYFDAHHPYIPINEVSGQCDLPTPKNPRIDFSKNYTSAEIDALRSAYDGCILGLDTEIGRLMKRLKDGGYLENTVVILTSDHGEHFGEHGLMEHCCSLYAQLIRVPLIILHPSRVPAGEVVTQPVSLRDLPATILDLAGLGQQRALPGDSLVPSWEAGRAAREDRDQPVLSELYRINAPSARGPISRGPMKSLMWRDYHYIRNGDGTEELYHSDADPYEETNLVSSAAAKTVLPRLRMSLEAYKS
jgi:arylsulfatase A-like enzyme